MTNPFDAPTSQSSSAAGTVDVGRTLNQAWEALQRNIVPGSLGALAAMIAIFVAEIACLIPVFVVGPALAWGMVRFSQQMLDGEADVGTLFGGFQTLGEYWASIMGGGLALTLGYLGLYVPYVLLSLGVGYAESMILSLLMLPVGLAFSAGMLYLGSRVMFWHWFILDQRMPAMEAIQRSWAVTQNAAVSLIFLNLALGVATIIGMLACGVGIFPAMALTWAAHASAYRQIIGR